jgi:hypothetical protein
MKSLHLFGLIVLAAATLYGQPTNGAVYWSVTPPDCSSLNHETPVTITNPAGARVGYSCHVTGTFVWLAAGAGWTTAIRVAGPASGGIGVDYTFFDDNGNNQVMDVTGSVDASSDEVTFALFDNQPSEIDLIGATVNAPTYPVTATGSVSAKFFCPDAEICLHLQPQLIYSALPSIPWSLSVPITWDTALSTTWSAVGIDNGGSQLVSFVVYNEDTVAHSFTIDVYDSDGNFFSRGFTPTILPLQDLGGGSLGEGGTYGALLKNVVNLPSGAFKVIVDGGPSSVLSAVSFLQFDGPSATSLQVAFDSPPGAAASALAARKASIQQRRMASTSKRVFKTLSKKNSIQEK